MSPGQSKPAQPKYEAQCQCGRLQVSAVQAPQAQLICHCNDCRAVSKQPFTPIAFFLPQGITVTGDADEIMMAGGTGKPKAYFTCKHCGDCLYATVSVLKGMVGIVADKIDAPFQFRPTFHVWTSEKANGVDIPGGAVQFPCGPPVAPQNV